MAFTINKNIQDEIHFLTITVIDWRVIFDQEKYCKIIIDCLKFHQNKTKLVIFGYVIMPNHIHLLVQSKSLIKFVNSFKSYTAYRINILENSGGGFKKIWIRNHHPTSIYSDYFFNQKLDYIHYNPVVKNYAKSPEDWYYSSAKNYISNDHSTIYINTNWV